MRLETTPKDVERAIALARRDDALPVPAVRNRAVLEISKSSQLDAQELDDEAIRILKTQAVRTLQFIAVSVHSLRAKISALSSSTTTTTTPPPPLPTSLVGSDVLDAMGRLLLWYFTFRLNNPTPGALIQNLRARNEAIFEPHPHLHGVMSLPHDLPTRLQRFGLLVLDVGFPLAWGRLRDYAVDEDWPSRRETEWYVVETIDKAHRLAALANLVAFLYDGRYRGLAERMLSLRLVYARDESVKSVSFEFINQQLLFEGLSNLLLVLLPLVNWDRLKRRADGLVRRFVKLVALAFGHLRRRFPGIFACVNRVSSRWWPNSKEGAEGERDLDEEDEEFGDGDGNGMENAWEEIVRGEDPESLAKKQRSKRKKRLDLKCVVCGANPATMAHIARPCGHAHCYYCLKIQIGDHGGGDGEDLVTCAACDEPILSADRVA